MSDPAPLWRRASVGLALMVVAAVVAIVVTALFGDRIEDVLDGDGGPVRVDFQAEAGCPSGRLSRLREAFDDPAAPLLDGAEGLVICHSEALETTAESLPAALVRTFPGCLERRGGGLALMRASPAVCALPEPGRFLCDGAAARSFPGGAAADREAEPTPCPAALLDRFGLR